MRTNEQLTATHDRLLEAVEALATGEDWRAMLEVSRRFTTYSLNNVLLIVAQRPEATRVAGYSTWKALGRQVRRGERGIAILAPCVYRRSRDQEAAEPGDHEPAGEQDQQPQRALRGFKVAHVFDVAQTDGEPLPDVRPEQLQGESPDAVFDLLRDELEAGGFHLLRADCRPANGKTHFLSRTVVVRPDLAPAQALKTLAHELAHTRLHDGSEYAAGCRDRVEVEAESVAYLVCAGLGLRTDAYSFPYVARWADGDIELVRSTASRVVTCAREILDALHRSNGGAGEDAKTPKEALAASV